MLWEIPQLAALSGGADCIPPPPSEQGRGSSARLKTELIFSSPLLLHFCFIMLIKKHYLLSTEQAQVPMWAEEMMNSEERG